MSDASTEHREPNGRRGNAGAPGTGAPGTGQPAGDPPASDPPVADPPSARPGVLRVLRRYFLTGLVVILPAAISGFVLWRLFFALDRILAPYVDFYLGRHIPGVGLVALIILIVIIGGIASNIIGKRLIRAGESLVERIPIVRWIYRTTKGISSAVLHERSTSFRKVVLINFPHEGIYSMAFQTSEPGEALTEAVGGRMVTVFLPTTPNPTSGFFLLIPEDKVIPLSMPVDEGLKLIISAGALLRSGDDEGW